MALRETEDNANAKFQSDQQTVLWYVMVFSGVVNYTEVISAEIGAAEGAVGQLFLPELEKISLVRKNTTQQFTIKEFLLE